MANKKSKNAGKHSKGERNSISKTTVNLMRKLKKEEQPSIREKNELDAWISGKNPWIKVINTDPNTRRKMHTVWVKSNTVWGSVKNRAFNMPNKKGN